MRREPQTIELDVRSHLRQKLEPFKLIMDQVKKLKKEDTLILHAIFKPTPLLGIMKVKGYVNKVEKIENDHWITTFIHKSRKHELENHLEDIDEFNNEKINEKRRDHSRAYELDNRGLEPPQPMIRTLKKLEEAQAGDTVKIHNDRVPMFLIEELNTLGYPYEVESQSDGSAKVTIIKK
jgi:TusA-related sulfurtransferase